MCSLNEPQNATKQSVNIETLEETAQVNICFSLEDDESSVSEDVRINGKNSQKGL